MGVSNSEQVEINIVGSSTFGRYPKISLEKTYNMFISDGWLVNYAGFKKQNNIGVSGEGRGFFNSIRGGFLIVVISTTVYRIDENLASTVIGIIATLNGDVSIDENLSSQICIVDGQDAYIYHYPDGTFTKQNLMFSMIPILPGYVCYHNTFFLISSSLSSLNSSYWYAFELDPTTTTGIVLITQLDLQTKPDSALVVKRLPGRGNNVLVLGATVGEVWTNVGGLENYRRVQSFNIDNGIVSSSTIAASDEFVCWLAQNENNSPFIMLTDGSSAKKISTDGIDFILSDIEYPSQSTAFFFRQDGHIFYQITFFNPVDNLSLIYDFTTNLFFHVSDQNLNFHPARKVVFFNEDTYFISILDGSIYKMDTSFTTYDYDLGVPSTPYEIPRIRICKSVRKKDAGRFRVAQFTFTIQEGVFNPLPPTSSRVDMSFSKNGNQSFSNIVGRKLNNSGHYQNQIRWNQMGQCNEFTVQLRFWGFQSFVCNNGILSIF